MRAPNWLMAPALTLLLGATVSTASAQSAKRPKPKTTTRSSAPHAHTPKPPIAPDTLSTGRRGTTPPTTPLATVDVPTRLEGPMMNCLVQVATESGYQIISFDDSTGVYELDKGFSIFIPSNQNPTERVDRMRLGPSVRAIGDTTRTSIGLWVGTARVSDHVVLKPSEATVGDLARLREGCMVTMPIRPADSAAKP